MRYKAVIQQSQGSRWLGFHDPAEVFVADNLEEVIPFLEEIERQVISHRLFAVGFISYEASPAFDTALKVRKPSPLPLLWFGLFNSYDELILNKENSVYKIGEWQPTVTRSEYDQAIAQIKDLIALGRTYQVNYTLRQRSPFEGDPWGLFVDLNRAQRANYGAYIDTGRQVLCSVSPELFFKLDGSQLESRPMKGTAPRGLTAQEDERQAVWLHKSRKNRAENVMIVDMIRNDMGRVGRVGSVHVPSLFDVERYPTLWQMTSTVRSETDASITDILRALFPCASITGAPKVSTMDIISRLESTPRGAYTGCIGVISPDRRAQFNVAIRTVVVDRQSGKAEYGVGGGIVWDSTSKDEYRECQTKALVLTQPPPRFQLLESILWQPEEGYFLLEEHLSRVSNSAEYFDYALDSVQLRETLMAFAATLPGMPAKVRVLVDEDGMIQVEAAALIPSDGVRLRLSITPVSSKDVFLYHKTTHRDVYDRANDGLADCDDVILWNERKELTETTTAN
ncbi:MAG: aminodeoxychorismate synthase component I, partial [Candidatus Promineifilaceae bacterium]